MEYFYIIGICIIIILILFFLLRTQYKKKYEERVKDIAHSEAERIKSITVLECKTTNDELQKLKTELADTRSKIWLQQSTIASLNNMISEKQNFNSTLQKIREEELDSLIQKEKEKRLSQLDYEISEWAESAQEAATFERDQILQSYQEECDKEYEKLKNIWAEINEYKAQRDAINEEILRSRAINEKQDFYRIQLDSNSKHDIDIINSIRPQIFKFETLNKLLYDNYISKPAKEMTKRVLNGRNPSGIYKVTNIETQEIYIGKSTSISDRWINHIKSACGLDGVADSQFQRALKKYGVDSFTWELLEEVPKDKLSNKEKYWIEFYNSKKYGYNERLG